jgi:hypothetical protein
VPQRTLGLGLELGAHGYVYRDAEADFSGGGVTLHALPLLVATRDRLTLELRGGRHQHLFSDSDTAGRRGVNEVGLRGSVATARHWAQADVRWLRAPDEDFPYLGVQAATSVEAGRLWGWVGKWLGTELDGAEFGIGLGLTFGDFGELWVSGRQDAGDPLVQTGERRTWNVGFSRTLGGPRARVDELGPRIEGGRVRIRLPEREFSGSVAPSVAGEFSQWQATSMRREGAEWVLDLSLAPGVYRFAFIRPGGEWFVPAGYPGRIDDGMGGYVAVMVVP